MNTAELFQDNIRRLMKRRKLNQAELAEKMNLNQGYISQLCTGRRNPSFAKIDDLCASLRCEPRELFQSKGKRK